jgi:hypothetical protein
MRCGAAVARKNKVEEERGKFCWENCAEQKGNGIKMCRK